jgi:MFS family permease
MFWSAAVGTALLIIGECVIRSAFARLSITIGLSNLADGILIVGMPLAALRLTESPVLIAATTAIKPMAIALAGTLVGTLADRFDRQWVLAISNSIRCILMLLLVLALSGSFASIGVLMVLHALLGLLEVVFDSTYLAMIPGVVGTGNIERANARLQSIQTITNELLGPSLVAIVTTIGLSWIFAFNAFAYISAAALAMVLVTCQPKQHSARTSVYASMVEGLQYIWQRSDLRSLLGASLAMNCAAGAFGAVFVIYVVGDLRLSESEFSVLVTGLAIGALLATLVTDWLNRSSTRLTRLAIAAGLMTAGIGVMLIVDSFVGLYIAQIVSGIGILIWNVMQLSLRQRSIPDQLQVRVNALLRSIGTALVPLGALLGGVVAQVWSVRHLYIGIFVFELAITIWLVIWAVLDGESRHF